MKQYNIKNFIEARNAIKAHYGENYCFDLSKDGLQLGNKQAWIICDKFGNKYLQSYNTIVSIYFADTQKVLRLGKWSVTTSRHQSEFECIV